MIEGRPAVTEDYTVVDLEMTGLTPKQDKIIEIGAVKVRGRKVIDTYGTLVKSARPIPDRVSKLTGITNEMMENGMGEDQAIQTLLSFIGDDVIVGHNISFDYSFLKQWAVNRKAPLQMSACDTLRIARALLPGEQSKKLEDLCNYFQIEREHAHRALDDAVETQKIYECLMNCALPEKKELFVPKLLTYKAKRQTPATAHQIERLKQLREKYQITDEIVWDTLTRSEASRLQDKYYVTYGR